MTIDNIQQHFVSYQTDNLENKQNHIQNIHDATGDAKHGAANKLLADETCRLLFGDSPNLLDDILNHPLSVDYFNVYLSLPIFGQRVLHYRINYQLDFDPPLLAEHQTCKQIYEGAKEWLFSCRLNNYIHTDIYIESLLGLLLTKRDDRIESSSKEIGTEEQAYIFSTVTDVRKFHQFLQLTSGIKYWNFFIDSMRLLRSRRSTRINRIDISYLNFIDKYYSQQHEFRSIIIDLDSPRMPDSQTSDLIWFEMAINAMHQLRVYWLPRYLSEVSPPLQSKIKHSTMKSNPDQIDNVNETSSNHLSNTESIINDPKLATFTLGNMSYLDYNPRQYILIQPSEEHDFQEDTEVSNKSEIDNDRIDKDCKTKFEVTSRPSSNRSIEDYATDANIELFYRILVSDSLAGSPFFEYISQTIPKIDVIPYQTCIHFITDAEVLLSIPSGKFKEKILRQFITRYLETTATEELPNQIFDKIEKQRTDLIKELTNKDSNQYCLLWEVLLKITKFLIPHFLDYIKFDRLRFLVQGNALNIHRVIDDLRRLLPFVNFESFLKDRQNTKETQLEPTESEIVSQPNWINYGERVPPLTVNELQQKLRQFHGKLEWKDIKTILGKSFDVPKTLYPMDSTTSISNEYPKGNPIETFTDEIMNSARKIFEIDCFISNLMDESLNLFQTNSSLTSVKSDLNSSPLSPIFDEILLTDSSPNLIINNTNKNAFVSSDSETNVSQKDDIIVQKPMETKIVSLIGSYFINSPSLTKIIDNFKLSVTINTKQISQKDDQQQLLIFIQNEINNHQWPLQEYIGNKGQRAWRALKLAADISNLDSRFMLNYHKDLDWFFTDNNLGSFGEQTYLIRRNFDRRIEQQKRCINKNS